MGVDFRCILETFGRHVGVILGTLEGYFFDGFWGTPGIQRREKVDGDQGGLGALKLLNLRSQTLDHRPEGLLNLQ